MLNAMTYSLNICEIDFYTKKLILLVDSIVATMKTAKGKDKVKTTKEALKPVDDRLILYLSATYTVIMRNYGH